MPRAVCAASAAIGGRLGRDHGHRQVQESAVHLLRNHPHPRKLGLPLGFHGALARNVGDHMTNLDREFFRLVDEKDTDGVIDFMASHPQFDANVQDYNGSTALVHAVKNEDADIIHYLQQLPNIQLHDAVLHAVNTGNQDIVEMLLDHHRRLGFDETSHSYSESDDFMPDITPLILAAHNEDYTVIRLLLKRGHFIHKPHPPNCFCKERCRKVKKKGETLVDSYARYNAYKALASPVFIGQTAADPILQAFQLSYELVTCAEKEPEFKIEYLELKQNCSQFAVELLDMSRTSEEVKLLLNNKNGFPRDPVDVGQFSRVALAVDMQQKVFVAHRHSQQVLRAAWLASWQDWRGLSFSTKLVRLLPRMFLLPLMSLLYWVAPKAKVTATWRSPINKFFSYVASYIVFLMLLYTHNNLDNKTFHRGAPNTGLEWAVVLYVAGFIWRDFKNIWKQGRNKFFALKWNWYNILMNSTFSLTFFTWLWAEYDVSINGDRFQPRSEWYQYDPTLIAEAFYSIGIIMSYGRLLYFFQIGNQLGPLQTSLSYMFRDICNFLVIFMVVVISFAMGLHKLYHYYTGQVRTINGEVAAQSDAFETFQSTLKTEFWALYGYTPPQYADVVIAEQIRMVNDEPVVVVNKHKFTEAVGYTLFAVYNVTAIIILLNMLIAMMSTSFMNVQENADIEWKFCRTQVWLEYFEEGGTLPPPFNLVPTPKTFYYALHWLYHKIGRNPLAQCSMLKCCFMQKEKVEEDDEEEYEELMCQLVRRYLRHRDHRADGALATTTNLGEIKHELEELHQVTRRLQRAVIGDDDVVSTIGTDR